MSAPTSGNTGGPDHEPRPWWRLARPPRPAAWVTVGLAALLVVGLVSVATQRARQAGGRPAAGYGQAAPGGGRPPAASAAPAIQLSGPFGAAVGHPSPRIAVPTLTGGTFRLPAGRPAVVLFTAAWCASCKAELAALQRIQQRHGDRVAILAVDIDPSDQPAAIKAALHAAGARYQAARDPDGWLAVAFVARALGTTVVVDPAGRVAWRSEGPTQAATLQAALRTAGLAR